MDTEKEIVYLQLEDIIPNRFQPREVFDENSLKELAVSIKEHGVIQPIIVRKVDDKYEIIAGERRYKAAALADLKKIPAIVRDIDDKESSKVTLLENLQRKNLNPMEEARTYQKILDLDQMTQEELAKTMGKSQSAVANKLRLLALPKKVQDALMNEQISERHARALLNLEDDSKKEELLDKIIATKMTVRELEKTINKLNTQSSGIDDLEENLPEVPIEEPQDSTTNDIPEEEGEAEPVPNLPTDDLQEQFTSDLPAEEENQEIPDVPIAEDGNDASVDITKPQEESVDVGVNSFINSDLITPDTEDKKTDKEYGEVTYAPPEGEEESQTGLPKFINYGEIDDDEDDGEEEKNLATSTSIDINDLKENTADIISIIDRPLSKMTCEVIEENGNKKIIPYHDGISISLNKNDKKQLTDGDIILVSIPTDEDKPNELIKIIKIGKIYIKDKALGITEKILFKAFVLLLFITAAPP